MSGDEPTVLDTPERVREAARKAPNQRVRLLMQFRLAADGGLTDEEAAAAAGLVRGCWWKRCGELRADGFIEQPVDRRVRRGSAGIDRIICTISAAGIAYLNAMEL